MHSRITSHCAQYGVKYFSTRLICSRVIGVSGMSSSSKWKWWP